MSIQKKRHDFKRHLFDQGMVLPGAYNALTAKQVQEAGFNGIYISGAALHASQGLPDIELLNLSDFVSLIQPITQSITIGSICDADTGFGSIHTLRRMIHAFEGIGLYGCHIEDQKSPKRCGHLNNKSLITCADMCDKIKSACDARRDPNFLIIARSDAYASEGMDGLLSRCNAYIEAGADLIFPEALDGVHSFEQVAQSLDTPLLANMTEFGKSPLIKASDLIEMGYKMVIFPVSALRIQAKASHDFYQGLYQMGTQQSYLNQMQTREALYQLLDYQAYINVDSSLNFKEESR